MSHRVLLDTTLFVHLLRGRTAAKEFFGRLEQSPLIVLVSAVTRAEIIFGCRDEDQEGRGICLMDRFESVPLTDGLCWQAGAVRRKLSGAHPGLADCLIAATALVMDSELLTHNVDHFNRVPDLRVRCPYLA